MTEKERADLLLQERINKEQEKANKSFMNLGFGTVAYFDIHFQLAILFAIMVLISLPSLYLFGFYKNGNRHWDGVLNFMSIGNIGFSNIVCKDTALAVNHLSLVCPSGQIGRIVSFGVIPSDAEILDACLQNEETKQCRDIYNEKYVRNEIELSCLGKSQ